MEFKVQILPEDYQAVINELLVENRELRLQLASARRIIRIVGVHEEPGERLVGVVNDDPEEADDEDTMPSV